MLKVSQKLEYAMRAMIELAQRREDDALVPAREIAARQQVPLRFLEQQLGALSKAGLVESFRGAGGGCRIARDPAMITVAEIADAIEGQIYPVFCLEPSDHTCFADSRCGLQGFWADVATAVQQVFERTTAIILEALGHQAFRPVRAINAAVVDSIRTWAGKRERLSVYSSSALFEFSSVEDLDEARVAQYLSARQREMLIDMYRSFRKVNEAG